MKLRLTIITLTALITSALHFTVHAQDTFDKGTNLLDAQISVGANQFRGSSILPIIRFGYERSIVDGLFDGHGSIGIGSIFGYRYVSYKSSFKEPYTNKAYTIKNNTHTAYLTPKVSLHYQFVPKLDTYATVELGIALSKNNIYQKYDKQTIISTKNNQWLVWGVHAGVRYYITPNVAAEMELGYGYSVLNIGVAYQF